ncbi:hypothetical protein Barb7_01957 [Bacteroidales bacterium Barb7]|nr:hypothetical protein Barb7_01957 [Bacteroidales bacterium Barb7]
MKLLAVTAIIIALYLMYRMAFPKQPETKEDNDYPPEKEPDTDDVVGKSHFVLGNQRQPKPTPAKPEKSENQAEKPDTFASENKKSDAVIPSEELDEVFSKLPEPMDMDYPLERETDEEPDIDTEEEAEELRQTLGKDAEVASGFTYEEMEQAVDAVNHSSEETEAEVGRVLSGLEKTDMFEQLVSGDVGREARIKSAIDRHVQSILPEETLEENNNKEYGDFNIADFLS